jgi:hypothetical protein
MGRTGESSLDYTPGVCSGVVRFAYAGCFLRRELWVSEGGLEPPPPYRGLGPQPSASTKFRHSDRVADRVYETHLGGSTSQVLVPLSRLPAGANLVPESTSGLCAKFYG